MVSRTGIRSFMHPCAAGKTDLTGFPIDAPVALVLSLIFLHFGDCHFQIQTLFFQQG